MSTGVLLLDEVQQMQRRTQELRNKKDELAQITTRNPTPPQDAEEQKRVLSKIEQLTGEIGQLSGQQADGFQRLGNALSLGIIQPLEQIQQAMDRGYREEAMRLHTALQKRLSPPSPSICKKMQLVVIVAAVVLGSYVISRLM